MNESTPNTDQYNKESYPIEKEDHNLVAESDDISESSCELKNDFDGSKDSESDQDSAELSLESTARYWEECTNSYSAAFEKGELFENNDEIKPVTASPSFECFASTRIGGRKENQDTAAFRLSDRGLLLIVCDGMGGGPSGKRASYMAAYVISRFVSHQSKDLSDAEILDCALQEAHKVLKFDATKNPENYGMGTTAAVLLINEEHAVFGHVGDSRIYQIRDGKFLRRTIDHSLVARKMQLENWTDEEARTSSESNIITQAIGHNDIEPEIEIYPYLKGDRFLICSDGIWGHYPQNELIKILNSSVPVGGALADLMVTTDNIGINEGNNHDNFTAILLQTKISSKTKDVMTKISKIIICILSAVLLMSIAFNIYQFTSLSKLQNTDHPEKEFNNVDVQDRNISQSTESSDQNSSSGLNVTGHKTMSPMVSSEERSDTLYIVKNGDLISKIAVQFQTTPDEIKLANPNIDLNKISIGQAIVIPLKRNKK